MTQTEKDTTLKNFMEEFFPFDEFKEIGMFTDELKGDYRAQAERVCDFFGYKSVYEYGATEVRAHLSYGDEQSALGNDRPLHVDQNGRLKQEPFVTVIPNIYE